MKKVKMTFSISPDVSEMLERRIPKRKRNAFIEEAIRGRFATMEEEQFLRQLVMDNKACDEELDMIDAGLEFDEGDECLSESEFADLDEAI
jgi:hypothetical protein